MVTRIETPAYHGQSLQFSPYLPNRLACVSGQNYGIAGHGRLYVIDLIQSVASATESYQTVCLGDWQDTLFDLSWSEKNPNLIVTAAGDGTVHVWDIQNTKAPLCVKKEHGKEVYSIDWSGTRDNTIIVTASWDNSIKLWDHMHPQSLCTIMGHKGVVYCSRWSPHIPNCIASVSGDNTLRIWDTNNPKQEKFAGLHKGEVLSCDWSKYDQNIIVTGCVDGCIYVWDIRNPQHFVHSLAGHQQAVRRVKCSPFTSTLIASCSYDMSVGFWDPAKQIFPLQMLKNHTEIVYGLDFNIHIAGQVADCSWDQSIHVYKPPCLSFLK